MLFFSLIIPTFLDSDDADFIVGLYDKFHQKIYARIYYHTADISAVEDLAQDVMMALCKKVSLLRQLDCNKLPFYIDSLCRNIAVSHIRAKIYQRGKEAQGLDKPLERFVSTDEGPEEVCVQRNQIERIRCLIERLPQSEKTAMEMRYFLHMTDDEIAQALSIKADSVRVAIHRGRTRLTALLQEEEKIDE